MSLAGKTILNTRPEGQAIELTKALLAKGASVVELPCIEFAALDDFSEFDIAFSEIAENDWIVFTSANGVKFTREYLNTKSVRKISASVAVIGDQTAKEARKSGFEVNFIASNSHSEGFAEELIKFFSNSKTEVGSFYLFRGDIASLVLPEGLSAAGFSVVPLTVYRSIVPASLLTQKSLLQDLLGLGEEAAANNTEKIDFAIFTSSQAARNLSSLSSNYGIRFMQRLCKLPVAVLGPTSAKTARELGLNVKVEARAANVSSVVQSLEQYYWNA